MLSVGRCEDLCVMEWLYGRKADLGTYGPGIQALSNNSIVLSSLPDAQPGRFSKFAPLYELVRTARNDAMHTGAYARHATGSAIELCIGLEEDLMYLSRRNPQMKTRQLVEDFMVKLPVAVELWQPIAYVRQLMLTHSFSFVSHPQDVVYLSLAMTSLQIKHLDQLFR